MTTSAQNNLDDVKYALRAKMNLLWVQTHEEDRAIKDLAKVSADTGLTPLIWSATRGLCAIRPTGTGGITYGDQFLTGPSGEPLMSGALFSHEGDLLKHPDPLFVMVKDITPELTYNPLLKRAIKDELQAGKVRPVSQVKYFCFIDTEPRPRDIRGIYSVDMSLPDRNLLGKLVDDAADQFSEKFPAVKARVVNGARDEVIGALSGLTYAEAGDALMMCAVKQEDLDPAVLMHQKKQLIQTQALKLMEPDERGMDGVGGLDVLKAHLNRIKPAFTQKAREWGLPRPKGFFLGGVPGTGKTLSAKCAATLFCLPLLKLDVGAVFGSLVGQSEANMREVIKTLEVMAPAVVLVDEIEKGFSGTGSSGDRDGGTTARVFGDFLQWLNDNDKGIFVIATANNPRSLPPELTRAGRFDAMYWLDLPNAEECTAIAEIMKAKYPRTNTDMVNAAEIGKAAASRKLTGSEIETAFTNALFEAFSQDREPQTADVLEGMDSVNSTAVTFAEELKNIREWGAQFCINATSKTGAKARTRKAASAGKADDSSRFELLD